MEKCRRLEEYAEFIQRIRDNLQKGMRLEGAVERAIEYCLAHGILADILRKGQMEVRNMLLEEYNEKADREYLRKESLEEGIKQGREEGRKEGREEGRKEGIALGGFEILAGLVEDGIISMEQAKERIKEKEEEFILWYQERKKR
jgi:predicted transposase YdaD